MANDIVKEIINEEYAMARKELEDRCKKGNIEFGESEGFEEGQICLDLGFPAGRNKRWIFLYDLEEIKSVLEFSFEKYNFLFGYNTIFSYENGEVEAAIESLAGNSLKSVYRKLFPDNKEDLLRNKVTQKLNIISESGGPQISIGPTSKYLKTFLGSQNRFTMSFKLDNVKATQHDQILKILEKLSNALFFQIDMLFDIPIGLQRDRKPLIGLKSLGRQKNKIEDLNYPESEYDEVPISLYWYGKSAVGMPLLQFLAFYQVIEFYFPTYYQAELRRKINLILKDPTFRKDREADVGKVISAIQQNRSGGLGDERSQLRATLNECIDAESLRKYLTSDENTEKFFSSKAKGFINNKLPIANTNLDLRDHVAERLYEIRCKIVHTKSSSSDGEFELLLPFSKEVYQLRYDINLIHYLAQRVLISGSIPLRLPQESK